MIKAHIKTYGAIASILALVSLGIWFRHSMSLWCDDVLVFSKSHPAIVLVLIGVIGEGGGILLKLFNKGFHDAHEHGIEIFEALCWMVVVIGLALEIPDASKTDRQAASANERASTLNLRIEELRKENNDFAIAQEPRQLDPFALLPVLEKTHGLNFVVINGPDWESAKLADTMEWSFEFEYHLFNSYQRWTYSRLVTGFNIPDGVHIEFPSPPNPFLGVITQEDKKKLNKDEVKAYMDFEPSKEAIDAGDLLKEVLSSVGVVVDNWGHWSDSGVLSRLGISTQTVPTNTVVILIGHKPDPKMVTLLNLRKKAFGVQMNPKSSRSDISNAWYPVFVAQEEYRQRQIRLGLWPTNAPHSIFATNGYFGDGAPIP